MKSESLFQRLKIFAPLWRSIIAAAAFVVFFCGGCKYEYVPVTHYTTTNSIPSRFKVLSSEYYHLETPAANMSLVLIADTQSTNEILVVDTMNGLSMMYVPKSIKQPAEKE